MEVLKLSELIEAIGGKVYISGKKDYFSGVSIDTRQIADDNLYIAIKGEKFNGNEFVKIACEKGASICIVDEIKFQSSEIENATIILVEDTRKALKDLAKYYRNKLNIKVVGVTGSTGKTTTKDLIAAALSEKYKVFKTKGNFNNEIGLPLMIFNLDKTYDVAILEMGMSNLYEIHRLADTARPDISVITNIGISHIENLGTRENILKAKLEITDFFNKQSVLIINSENDMLMNFKSDEFIVKSIGYNTDFSYCAKNIELMENKIAYDLYDNNKLINNKVSINIVGQHNVLNSLLAIAVAREFNVDYTDIVRGFINLEATSMRLDIVKVNGMTLIDDSYNASPDSMKAALDVQKNIKGGRKIAVLGTMRELGKESYNCHLEVGKYAGVKGIDMLIATGEYVEAYKEGFNHNDKFYSFESNDLAAEFLLKELKENDVILVKASRSMKFETIVNRLKN
ncbi:UDP-N-acetylmuramoyl-tripeptide--D-alanyl-D-alanine ligase [Clostridium sp. 19966]|uniref:UDP-N-acetylmuramoyl-tripeptide--D-alanyl-D- alanine ligase n=1 Tax=Clostridium sp. 19966 TaxID=2768166 RepID=UPI0028DEEAB1|nr:UDP-N-acetylmuramoyl-tripeptide--D-alanyl-D-alanine ligase [Clostridium sp. 19966]MDT8716622.1 UDP-N-acetylmuramoyl-tripeptide--D-alanyl-D-alanine ligase [Clostridium sp. 19966]